MWCVVAAGSRELPLPFLWVAAGVSIIVGLVLALNVRGAAEGYFRIVARRMPYTGSATPNTVRFVGAAGVVIGTGMLIPDVVGLLAR